MDGKLGVLDVIDGGADFYYRLLGTKVAALKGYELTGKYVSVLPEVVRDAVLKEIPSFDRMPGAGLHRRSVCHSCPTLHPGHQAASAGVV